MDHLLGLERIIRSAGYAAGGVEYVCPKHGDDGALDIVYDDCSEPDQPWLARISAAEASAHHGEGHFEREATAPQCHLLRKPPIYRFGNRSKWSTIGIRASNQPAAQRHPSPCLSPARKINHDQDLIPSVPEP